MNEVLIWFSENWFMLVVAFCVIIVTIATIVGFFKTPKEMQVEKIRQCLLNWVVEAEKQFGSSTGKIKLSYCWDLAVQRFPAIGTVISFETFSLLVDEALEKMRTMLETNKNLQDYIYGKEE